MLSKTALDNWVIPTEVVGYQFEDTEVREYGNAINRKADETAALEGAVPGIYRADSFGVRRVCRAVRATVSMAADADAGGTCAGRAGGGAVDGRQCDIRP